MRYCIYCVLAFCFLSLKAGPFERHPQTHERILTNQNVVPLPVSYADSWGLVVQGSALKSVVKKIIQKNGLQLSSKHEKGDRYTVVYYFVEHKNSSIQSDLNPTGGYGEFFTAIPVKPHASRKNGYLVEQMIVSDEDALLAGREIWGINKSKAQFTMNWNSGFGGFFSLNGKKCNMSIRVSNKKRRLKLGLPPLFPLPFGIEVPLISTTELGAQGWTDTILHGRPKVAKWNEKYDAINAYGSKHCSTLYRKWSFKPQFVVSYKRAKALLFDGMALD